jgi:hypothetical protein
MTHDREGQDPESEPERQEDETPAEGHGVFDPVALVRSERVPSAVDVVLADPNLSGVARAAQLRAHLDGELLDQLVLGALVLEERVGIAALRAGQLEQSVLVVLRGRFVVEGAAVLQKAAPLGPERGEGGGQAAHAVT